MQASASSSLPIDPLKMKYVYLQRIRETMIFREHQDRGGHLLPLATCLAKIPFLSLDPGMGNS